MNLDSLSISKQGSLVVLVCSFRIPKSLLETVVSLERAFNYVMRFSKKKLKIKKCNIFTSESILMKN